MSDSIRTTIRKNIAARLLALYGPSGTVNHMLRAVQAAVWTPPNAPQARCSVMDNGQKRAGYKDCETEKSFALGIELNFDLPAHWEKEYDTWCDLMQSIIIDFQNRLFSIPGAERCEYEDDDPISVTLSDGTESQVWVMHFRVTYSAAVGEIGKT